MALCISENIAMQSLQLFPRVKVAFTAEKPL